MTSLATRRRPRPFRRSHAYRALAALLLAFAAACAVPAAAAAEEPVRFGSSDIIDAAGVLYGKEAAVEQALQELYADTSIQLLVAYVDTFDGLTPATWAERTAELNGLGSNDVLLAVAIDDRNYVTWYPNDFELSERKTLSVEQDDIEPKLRADDWSGAAIAAAEGYADASQGINWLPILGGAAVIGVGIWGFGALRRRRAANAQKRADAARLEELEQRASVALVALDDELMTSGEELAFAAAQFGEETTKPFRDAVTEARAKSMAAFALKQRLDDTEEEPDSERAAMAEQIIALTAEGDAVLDSQAAAFAELRELERNAPQALVEAAQAAAELEERVAASDRTLGDLRERYAPSALTAVSDNAARARELLGFAAESRDAAERAIEAGKTGDAAVQVRAAQATAGRIAQLIDAVDALAAELADATARLADALRDAQDGLAAAQALSDDPRIASAQDLKRAMEKAASAVERASSREGQRDPITSLTALIAADAELDRVLAAAREEQERTARALRQLPDSIKRAETAVAQASSFITTRRGGVREHARTRLAEAERLLASAVASQHDPTAAVSTALRAASTADAALARAQSDVQAASGYGSSGGNESAVLGALLGDLLFGGSVSRGSSWGGSSGGWSGSSRGGRSSSSSSRSRSSSSRRSSSRSSRSSRGRTGGGRF